MIIYISVIIATTFKRISKEFLTGFMWKTLFRMFVGNTRVVGTTIQISKNVLNSLEHRLRGGKGNIMYQVVSKSLE